MRSNARRRPHRVLGRAAARGFALLEALAALALVAFSLLALGAGYLKLNQGEETARHRGEAALLAQQRIESLRGYTAIDGAAGSATWNNLVAGNDTVQGNVAFARRWTLGGSNADPQRPVRVQVDWTDRSGTARTFALASVIARADPADAGSLAFPLPENTTLKRPKNRNLNIPLPASDLGGGESAFRLPGTNFAVVFSNDSGYVIRRCTAATSGTTLTREDLSACVETNAYVLAGYVTLDGSATFPSGLALSSAALVGLDGTPTCSVSDITQAGNGSSTTVVAKYYLCVLTVPTRGASWGGTARLAAASLSTGNTGLLVCRFQYPDAAGLTPAQRNVQPYAGVSESLDNQNYVLSSKSSCPTVAGLATTLHQDCRSGASGRGVNCPAQP